MYRAWVEEDFITLFGQTPFLSIIMIMIIIVFLKRSDTAYM